MSLASEIEPRLRSHGLKQHGKNWRGPSPFRADSDSDAFSVTIEGPDEGVYNDFVAGEGGNLYQLAERFGIAVERTAVETTKRAYRGLEDYALQHGSTADIFKAARWMETTHDGRPALAFDTPNGTRYRFLDGNKPPYKSPSGYESCWYGLVRAVNHVMKGDAPLVLVNGEASTVVCQSHGIPAACVTSGGERTLSKELLDELRSTWTGRIVIAFDCDKAGRKNADALRAQLTDYSTAVVDFGLGDGGDAADWCKLHGEKAWERLLERAKFTTKDAPAEATPKYITAAALMDQVSSFYAKVQAGEVKMTLPTGIDHWDKALNGGLWSGLNFLAGPMGSGKSTLAASLVGNWTRMGKRGFIVTTEMSPGQWVARVWAHLAGVRTDELQNGNYNPAFRDMVQAARTQIAAGGHIFRVEGSPTSDGIRDDLLKLVSNGEIDFVVIDSSSNMHASGASNSIFDQTKAVTNQLAALSSEAQAITRDARPIPFVVTHQTNANNLLKRANKTATMLDAYGGQSPAQDATTYTVINYLSWFVDRDLADADPDYPKGVAALIVDKHRYFMNASDKPVRVRYEPGMGFYGDRVPPVTMRKDTGGKVVSMPRQYKDDDMPADLYGPTGTADGRIEF
jgi:archaellum biogenesis ATPase FlaH